VPELTVADVESYTGGRLLAAAPETVRLLGAALKAARRYCGWHVTPVQTDTGVALDGPGGRVLSLPTLQLVELTAVSEDGITLDVDDLYVSSAGLVRKKSGCHWSCRYGGVVVTMEHGYVDATDWQSAVLELVDRMSTLPGNVLGNSGPVARKRVDDVELQWALSVGTNESLFDLINHRLMDPYRIDPLG
jgi:hypothetical protein